MPKEANRVNHAGGAKEDAEAKQIADRLRPR
jgi:hypothetical protein